MGNIRGEYSRGIFQEVSDGVKKLTTGKCTQGSVSKKSSVIMCMGICRVIRGEFSREI